MKRNTIITASVLAMALCLTGCDKTPTNSEESSSTTSSTTESGTSSTESSTSSMESSATSYDNAIYPDKDYVPESFEGYAGETLYKKDASDLTSATASFNGFTYLRWATPVFENTLDNPKLIDPDTGKMSEYLDNPERPDPEWFVVKTGDKLENGLVVKSAECIYNFHTYEGELLSEVEYTAVEFENQLTLTGLLCCNSEDEAYTAKGDLLFLPDTVANKNVPYVHSGHDARDSYRLWSSCYGDIYFVFDGMEYKVGNINDSAVDYSGIIDNGGICKVKVTLDNISLAHSFFGGRSGAFADIVSVEKIS